MNDKIVSLPILPELPVGAVFKFKGSTQRYRVAEVDEYNVLYRGYSVCEGCALFASEKDPRCHSFICAGIFRKDRTYVKAERVEEEE